MAKGDVEREKLLGLLALHADFITHEDLLIALGPRATAETRPLGRLLVERGALSGEELTLLESLVDKHIARNGGEVGRSLASFGRRGPAAGLAATLAFGGASAGSLDFASASTVGMATAEGQRFGILRFLARGGLGKVSVALDKELHREVALKELHGQFVDDAESRARFLLEAEITGSLEHPGIVPVYGLGQYPDGRPFYAMRL